MLSPKRPEVVATNIGGTTVLILRDSTFALVRFTISLRYGALADPPGKEGLWELLLPLLLRGTKNKSREQFNRELDRLGSSVDTSVTHECAFISGTALKSELEKTLRLIGEALAQPALDEDAFLALRDEALQELYAERDDDEAVAELFLRRALYQGHPFATPAAGSMQSLNNLTLADLRTAWQGVGRNHLIVGLVGDIDVDEGARLAQKVIMPIQEHGRAVPDVSPPVFPKTPQIWIVDKPERTQVQLRVAIGGIGPKHPDLDAFWLGIVAFGGTFTSPLTREVRDVRGWSYFASAEFRRRARFDAPVVLRTAPALDDAVSCLTLKLELLGELSRGQLEPEPLRLARDYLLGRVPLQLATAYDLMGPAILLELLGLTQDRLYELPQKLMALDLHHVPFVLGKHLAQFAPVSVLVAPAETITGALKKAYPTAAIHVVPHTQGLLDEGRALLS